jgi:PTS system nitrogen regulatory IIA component
MVHLTSYLAPDQVLLDADATSKDAALALAGTVLAAAHAGLAGDDVAALLQARERVASTGVGDGIAIPHAVCPTLREPLLALLRTRTPIDFDAIDQQPVRLMLIILAPSGAHALHLRLIARMARLVRDPRLRAGLFSASSPGEAYALLGAAEGAKPARD